MLRSWGNMIESHVGNMSGLRIRHSSAWGRAGVFEQKSDKNFAGTMIPIIIEHFYSVNFQIKARNKTRQCIIQKKCFQVPLFHNKNTTLQLNKQHQHSCMLKSAAKVQIAVVITGMLLNAMESFAWLLLSIFYLGAFSRGRKVSNQQRLFHVFNVYSS